LDGWEPEQEYIPPKVDQARAEAAKLAQGIFSVRRINLDDGDWSNTKIDLPISRSNNSENLPIEIHRLLSEGTRKGWLTSQEIDAVILSLRASENYKRIIHVVIEQFQIELRPSHVEQIFSIENFIDDIELLDFEGESETADFIEALLNFDCEAKYLSQVKEKQYQAKSIQSSLWMRIEELRRRAVLTIASMPCCVELLIKTTAFSSYDNLNSIDVETIAEEELVEDEKEEQGDLQDIELQIEKREKKYLRELISMPQEERAIELTRMRPNLDYLQRIALKAKENKTEGAKILENLVNELSSRMNKVIETNLGLVTWFANRYRGCGLDYLDLVQEGNIGLIKAVHRFDPSRGAKLSTYAIWWIRQSITRAISDKAKTIRIPVHVQERARKLKHLSETLRNDQHMKLTKAEIIEKLEMNEITFSKFERGLDLVQARGDNVGQIPNKILLNLVDFKLGVEDQIEHKLMSKVIARTLLALSPREERILRMRFGFVSGEELTLEEIGHQFDVTRERIRQIENKAIRRLSRPSRLKTLKGFLYVQ
jgi:RNA polymerase primary sigma factor